MSSRSRCARVACVRALAVAGVQAVFVRLHRCGLPWQRLVDRTVERARGEGEEEAEAGGYEEGLVRYALCTDARVSAQSQPPGIPPRAQKVRNTCRRHYQCDVGEVLIVGACMYSLG